jgi:PTS system nitrogen regulatory IIA component
VSNEVIARQRAPRARFVRLPLVGHRGSYVQLSIRDLTRLLNVAESTVSRWIRQRGLPAQQVGGQYRVNRAELLEWATANNVKVSLELFDNLDAGAEAVPTLREALEVGGIHYQLRDTSKDRALRALVEVLPLPDGLDRELLLRLFLAREASASTAIGHGIAIPHVRNPIVLHVARPAVTLAFLERPVDFGALDGKPVHVLFSLISPTTRTHLQLLSRLSFALHDEKFRETVVREAPREEILQEVHRVEAGMGAPGAEAGKAAPQHGCSLMSELLVLLGTLLAATSGTPGLLFRRQSTAGPWLTALLASAGAGLGLAGAAVYWVTRDSQPIELP